MWLPQHAPVRGRSASGPGCVSALLDTAVVDVNVNIQVHMPMGATVGVQAEGVVHVPWQCSIARVAWVLVGLCLRHGRSLSWGVLSMSHSCSMVNCCSMVPCCSLVSCCCVTRRKLQTPGTAEAPVVVWL